MTINRFNWTKLFQPNALPLWICPRCKQNALILKPNTFNSFLTADSEVNRSHPNYEPDYDQYRYTALLVCSSESCGEQVISTGEGFVEFDYYYDSSGDTQTSYEIYYQPKYFNPCLEIFSLPDTTPQPLKKAIYKSFELFFTDSEASLNQLRSSIEVLLNELGVDRNDKNGNPLKLHSRLDKLKGGDAKYKDSLKAIKWLGNAGSHSTSSTKVNIEDVLDGYEILQPILHELFRSSIPTLEEKVAAINANKGPVSKSGL